MSPSIRLLTSLEEHQKFLRDSLLQCSESDDEDIEVKDCIIFSPYIRLDAMEMDKLRDILVKCNENLKIYTSDTDNECKSGEFASTDGRKFLAKLHIDFDIVHNLHTKCLILGEDCIAIGSFNWLSASRHERFTLHDVTTVITGSDAIPLIEQVYSLIPSFKIKNPIQSYLIPRIANKTHAQYLTIFGDLFRENKGLLRTEHVYEVFNEVSSDKSARHRLLMLQALFDIDPHYPVEDCSRFVTNFLAPTDDEESLFLNIKLRDPELRKVIVLSIGTENKFHTKKVNFNEVDDIQVFRNVSYDSYDGHEDEY